MAIALALGAFFWTKSSSRPPSQPIAFSHKVHAGENKIPCLYCHAYARRSPAAGVPSVERCMGCHKITGLGKPEVEKIHAFWEQKQPIPWVRVYRLPDFVYFSHKRHILKAVPCQSCHGEVEKMDEVAALRRLEMGWCLGCHRKEGADTDCLTCHK